MLTKKTTRNQVKDLKILQTDKNQNLKTDYLSEIQKAVLQVDKNTSLTDLLQFTIEKIMYYEREDFLLKTNIESSNKWNWFYKRFLNVIWDKMHFSIPRDRNWLYNPLILNIIKNEEKQHYDLISQLYTKWLTHWDISSIMKNIYKKQVSSASITNITKWLIEEFEIWNNREFKDWNQFVWLYIDWIFQSVKRWKSYSSEWFTIILWIKLDWTREVLWIYSTPEESSSAWWETLQNLKERWVTSPLYVVADWIKWFDNQVKKIFPKAYFQRCIVHKKRNVLNKVKTCDKLEIAEDLKDIFTVWDKRDTKERAMLRLDNFIEKWTKPDKWNYKFLNNMFKNEEKEYYFSYMNFPIKIQSMIYTTNWLERFNKSARKKLKIRNWLPNEESVMKLIFATALELWSWTYSYKIWAFSSSKEELLKIKEEKYWNI